MKTSRRRFLRQGAALGTSVALPWLPYAPAASAAPGGKLAKYVQPVPLPGRGIVIARPSGTHAYAFTQREIRRQVHPDLPPTPVWAYDDGSGLVGQAGSLGPCLFAQAGVPITVSFTHALPATYPAWLPVDTRLTPLGNQVRVMTHLHGGFVDSSSDGSPATTPHGFGPGETQTVLYTNQRPQMSASFRWFHDHAMGATRLNVAAGLAGAYILRDELDTGEEPNPIGLPGGDYEIPLVIQDRMFNADGTLLYPTSDIAGVTWIGEYFGDVMLVNGKAWPYLDLEPRLYRVRILNACNARILSLDIGGARCWQIGADSGLFDMPVPVGRIVLAPAERADLLVDFAPLAGRTSVMKNFRAQKPVSNPAPQLDAVMQLRVGTQVTRPGPASIPSLLPGRAAQLGAPVKRRYITLNEVDAEQPGWHLDINGLGFADAVTEAPRVGTIEEWVLINLTEDTHPIHVHLVSFQVAGRIAFNADAYADAHPGSDGVPGGIDPSPYVTGALRPADPGERGFKDTVKANPGELTIIRAYFELPSGVSAPQSYVYHCHMVEHEDNEMMRPFTVVA